MKLERNGKCPLAPVPSHASTGDEQIKENVVPGPEAQATTHAAPTTGSPNTVRHNSGDIIHSLLSTPSYRQNTRVVRPGPELEALILSRQRAGQ